MTAGEVGQRREVNELLAAGLVQQEEQRLQQLAPGRRLPNTGCCLLVSVYPNYMLTDSYRALKQRWGGLFFKFSSYLLEYIWQNSCRLMEHTICLSPQKFSTP
jgi:hypothetical protein